MGIVLKGFEIKGIEFVNEFAQIRQNNSRFTAAVITQ